MTAPPFALGRAESFIRATERYPDAFADELREVSRHVFFDDGGAVRADGVPAPLVVVHLNAAGNSLRPWLPAAHTLLEFELHAEFGKASNLPVVDPSVLPFPDDSVDRVVVLAVLHHFSQAERRRLYAECRRVLRRSTGRLIVADVIRNSPQARWLNGFVDAHCPTGHRGEFFDAADADPMLDAGFSEVTLSRSAHSWRFDRPEDRDSFLRGLFCFPEGTPIDAGLAEVFGRDSPASIPWSLLFLVARR